MFKEWPKQKAVSWHNPIHTLIYHFSKSLLSHTDLSSNAVSLKPRYLHQSHPPILNYIHPNESPVFLIILGIPPTQRKDFSQPKPNTKKLPFKSTQCFLEFIFFPLSFHNHGGKYPRWTHPPLLTICWTWVIPAINMTSAISRVRQRFLWIVVRSFCKFLWKEEEKC